MDFLRTNLAKKLLILTYLNFSCKSSHRQLKNIGLKQSPKTRQRMMNLELIITYI